MIIVILRPVILFRSGSGKSLRPIYTKSGQCSCRSAVVDFDSIGQSSRKQQAKNKTVQTFPIVSALADRHDTTFIKKTCPLPKPGYSAGSVPPQSRDASIPVNPHPSMANATYAASPFISPLACRVLGENSISTMVPSLVLWISPGREGGLKTLVTHRNL